MQSAKGIDEPELLDSLAAATARLPYFQPAVRDGVPVESVYGIYFTYPTQPGRGLTEQRRVGLFSNEYLSEEDLEDYEFSRTVFLLDYNLFFSQPFGKASKDLKAGGGLDLVFGTRLNEKWGVGLGFGADFANQKRSFPEDALQREDNFLGSVYLSGVGDRLLHVSPRQEWVLRGELGYTSLNFQTGEDERPEAKLAFGGVQTGLSVHYTRGFSHPTTAVRDVRGRAVTSGFSYKFFGGVRHRYFGDNSGTGFHIFLGAGFRIGSGRWERRAGE